MKLDSCRSTIIPSIFPNKDWSYLLVMFKDPIKELIKEFFANAFYSGIELKCWVRGKAFIFTPDYNMVKVHQIEHPMEADRTPYDERSGSLDPILALLGTNFHVSTKGTSIGTDNFSPEVKTLALILYSNLYPLTNSKFIITSQAKFLFDLIFGTPIDICAHIFQTFAKTFVRLATRTCLPFRSLMMKIPKSKGVPTPLGGIVLVRQRPISL